MTDTILIVAERLHQFLYRGLGLKGKQFYYCPLHIFLCKEILAREHGHGIDLILLDCGFDSDRGLNMLNTIKAEWQHIPVIFLTDASSEDLAIRAFREGAREYFRKPFNLHEFTETIEKILMIKKSSREHRKSLKVKRVHLPNSYFEKINSNMHSGIFRALRYIERNLRDDLPINKLAEEANLSKYHFCRMFKKQVGTSPTQLVITMRIEKAKQFLKDKKLPVSMVAVETGFNDPSNFSRQFKRATGLSPSAYLSSIQ
jgi:AraC family transcriptional regulator